MESYNTNIHSAVPPSGKENNVNLQVGVEIRCRETTLAGEGNYKADEWYEVFRNERNGLYITSGGDVWDIVGDDTDNKYFDLSNPRWPEAVSKDDNGWISVDEREPEKGQIVLAYGLPTFEISDAANNKAIAIVIWDRQGYSGMVHTDYYAMWLDDITHWQPLPNPPKAK